MGEGCGTRKCGPGLTPRQSVPGVRLALMCDHLRLDSQTRCGLFTVKITLYSPGYASARYDGQRVQLPQYACPHVHVCPDFLET